MIASIGYTVNGAFAPHDGEGRLDTIPLDLSSMHIPDGYPESSYTIELSTDRNFHEFSSTEHVLSIRADILDGDTNTITIDNSYYANFIEI